MCPWTTIYWPFAPSLMRHEEARGGDGSRGQKSRRARGMTALVSISQFSPGRIIFTYIYVNTSELDDAANPPPWADAAHVCALSKISEDQDSELECIVRVPMCTWRMRYRSFAPSVVCDEGPRCDDDDVTLTGIVNVNTGGWFMFVIVDVSSTVHS
jgi:hypothetical protein